MTVLADKCFSFALSIFNTEMDPPRTKSVELNTVFVFFQRYHPGNVTSIPKCFFTSLRRKPIHPKEKCARSWSGLKRGHSPMLPLVIFV